MSWLGSMLSSRIGADTLLEDIDFDQLDWSG
jgi:hypothetical protein